MSKITTLLTAAALATGLAACGSETETNDISEAMPETRDISETASDEQVVREGALPSESTTETPPAPETIPTE
ncbi:hypothetical protein [Brevundimonas halotolerans]|uniref:Secreted protein n=1 Tax=Brevundimonas halotolerans TaxID=69670 RepID=A0A7W9E7K4_9CAUL|nr:hypothetical protein [Brevundimonas halotolerans]MBB5660054.1 hypothetical protein [Brevundimonas halotolerans]